MCIFSSFFLTGVIFLCSGSREKLIYLLFVLFLKDKIPRFTSGICRQMVQKHDRVHLDKGGAKTKGGRRRGGGVGGRTVAASPVMSCVSVSRCQAPWSGLPPGRCCRPKCSLRRFHPKEPTGMTPPPKASANMETAGGGEGGCRLFFWGGVLFLQ